jgi:DNA-binding GntR family transcriptional regulator
MSDTVLVWNLNERVYEELRTRVLTRQEPAGAKLSLHVLAAELGVSRSPVHHALTRLVSEGLLTVRPRRGYYVAPVTAQAVAEGYDVRLALELLAAERAIGSVTIGDLDRFSELLAATDAAISTSSGMRRMRRSTNTRSISLATRCCRASTASCR